MAATGKAATAGGKVINAVDAAPVDRAHGVLAVACTTAAAVAEVAATAAGACSAPCVESGIFSTQASLFLFFNSRLRTSAGRLLPCAWAEDR